MDTSLKRSFIVGIAGGSASGKSTLAAALQEALTDGQEPLQVEAVNMDRYFYRGAPGGPMLVVSSSPEPRFNANHPDSADNARLVADVTRRSQEADAPDVIIIEGLMALYVPIIREMLDLRLFVQLDADIRALRRMLRGRGRTAASPLTPEGLKGGILYYVECARVGHERYVQPSSAYADLILRGDADLDRSAALLADIVRTRVATTARGRVLAEDGQALPHARGAG